MNLTIKRKTKDREIIKVAARLLQNYEDTIYTANAACNYQRKKNSNETNESFYYYSAHGKGG